MKTTRIPVVVIVSVVLLLMGFGAAPAFAGGIAILSTSLTDNGDHDGIADGNETVELFLTVENTSGANLAGVTATLYALDPARACLSVPQIAIGDLAAGESRTTTNGFVFTVGDVDRTTLGLGPYDPLVAEFYVSFDSAGGPVAAHSQHVDLDLDLDVSGGSGAASFLEDFESETLGQFEIRNLDNGLDSLATSEDYRCQYNDPDNPDSNSFNRNECFLGPVGGHAAATWWSISGPAFSPLGGRGFGGFHSAFFGRDDGPTDNWTTPLSVLEAIAMTDPVHIAADAPAPELVFKHQNSLADSRAFALPAGHTYDRGVVMVQVTDDTGSFNGRWYKVDPYRNHYDQQNSPNIINCGFDPVDDGNDEDNLFGANTRYGPSSTCYPEYIFANMGETSSTFDATHLGNADGPGLLGLWGIGTWVESRVDLSRFRGRSIRVRFLATSLEITSVPADTWEDLYNFNPNPGDDGWWIDDIEITGLVATAATVVNDDKDNSGLPDVTGSDVDSDGFVDTCDNCPMVANANQFDSDIDALGDVCDLCPLNQDNSDPDLDSVCGEEDNCPLISNPGQTDDDNDGFGAACDCDDTDFTTNPAAVESNDAVDQNCNGAVDELNESAAFAGDKTTLSWDPQANAFRYQVASATAADFSAGCTAVFALTNQADVPAVPAPGEVIYLDVRSVLPNTGDWGLRSSGGSRTVPCAP